MKHNIMLIFVKSEYVKDAQILSQQDENSEEYWDSAEEAPLMIGNLMLADYDFSDPESDDTRASMNDRIVSAADGYKVPKKAIAVSVIHVDEEGLPNVYTYEYGPYEGYGHGYATMTRGFE